MKKISPNKLKSLAKAVIKTEEKALSSLIERVDNKFVDACNIILNCQGRIVVTGMGKSGHIGNKIAATLASTGTPAFFVHPGEASHGDLGMISKDFMDFRGFSGSRRTFRWSSERLEGFSRKSLCTDTLKVSIKHILKQRTNRQHLTIPEIALEIFEKPEFPEIFDFSVYGTK